MTEMEAKEERGHKLKGYQEQSRETLKPLDPRINYERQ